MQIIPVIDLKNGISVHAKQGQRHHYQGVKTPLCPSNKVTDIIDDFLNIHSFDIIYLADLNAIMNTGNHQVLIKKLLKKYPQIMFWVDQGYQKTASPLSQFKNYCAVLGSESYPENTLETLKTIQNNFILSLDYSSEDQPLGAKALFSDPSWWTAKTIVMTLARVGSSLGVDIDKLHYFQQLNPKIDWVASGGVQSVKDVLALKKIGVQYVLCASALHYKKITRCDFKQF
jgi:phosphoribosylformimino-5-aminoimidazole carboxamide ribotide isomerase